MHTPEGSPCSVSTSGQPGLFTNHTETKSILISGTAVKSILVEQALWGLPKWVGSGREHRENTEVTEGLALCHVTVLTVSQWHQRPEPLPPAPEPHFAAGRH